MTSCREGRDSYFKFIDTDSDKDIEKFYSEGPTYGSVRPSTGKDFGEPVSWRGPVALVLGGRRYLVRRSLLGSQYRSPSAEKAMTDHL